MTERKAAQSAGVLFYRRTHAGPLVLLVHPGGPYWRRRDRGAWQIPKGLIGPDESPEAAARREVAEELGLAFADPLEPLGHIRQAGGKWIEAFACERAVDADGIVSNRFEMEWPPRSGRRASFPEVDAARWFTLAEADDAILASQRPLLRRMEAHLAGTAAD